MMCKPRKHAMAQVWPAVTMIALWLAGVAGAGGYPAVGGNGGSGIVIVRFVRAGM